MRVRNRGLELGLGSGLGSYCCTSIIGAMVRPKTPIPSPNPSPNPNPNPNPSPSPSPSPSPNQVHPKTPIEDQDEMSSLLQIPVVTARGRSRGRVVVRGSEP